MRTRFGRAFLCMLALSCWPVLAAAQSEQVVIIGGSTLCTGACGWFGTEANVMGRTAGGMLPVTDPGGALDDFTFAAMLPADVSTANLAAYDTAVLNVASVAMGCTTATLTTEQKDALIQFVDEGNKLIIFDSECPPVDYSWMPYPFETSNPGALGRPGTLTIVEENTLSSANPASPYYLDAFHLGVVTDAVGDMNVMTTYSAGWCIDMSGTNANGVSGPVHTYAKFPLKSDKGLIIYNGLDQDYLLATNDAELRKMWVLELKQPFNPSNLPCGFTIIGIALTPATASNHLGTAHSVTATLTDLLGHPRPDVPVTITVVSGPNAGAEGTATTDADGQMTFTYTGGGGVGTDVIEGCFDNEGVNVCSDNVAKEWTNNPPIALCQNITIDAGAGCSALASVDAGSSDPDGDPFVVTEAPVGPYPVGETTVTLTIQDSWGATASCTGTVTVRDVDMPVVSCTPWVNPSGKNIPKGSNEDGFFTVMASDGCSPGGLHVTLGDYPLELGKTINGLPIKLTQSPGFSGVTLINVMGELGILHFRVGPDDAVLTADDGAGNVTTVTCLVPPPPK